jgi:hypothetical protein
VGGRGRGVVSPRAAAERIQPRHDQPSRSEAKARHTRKPLAPTEGYGRAQSANRALFETLPDIGIRRPSVSAVSDQMGQCVAMIRTNSQRS